MKIILFSIALIFPLLVVCQVGDPAEDETIIRQCITDNGSVYDLELDPVTRQGNIRLRWQGQDVFYDAMIMITEHDKLTGIAQLSKSMTGETKATPWIFSYNKSTNTLNDNECIFQMKPATDSIASLPPIPRQSCHPFQSKSATL